VLGAIVSDEIDDLKFSQVSFIMIVDRKFRLEILTSQLDDDCR